MGRILRYIASVDPQALILSVRAAAVTKQALRRDDARGDTYGVTRLEKFTSRGARDRSAAKPQIYVDIDCGPGWERRSLRARYDEASKFFYRQGGSMLISGEMSVISRRLGNAAWDFAASGNSS
ncbi:hypothetical protein AGR4B_pAt20316 [Agrobacterium tumefaciens str. CFBP 5621]|nr:hypothetical protein AGR4B_pAt20316 [Agrobacterium tumefaciens str. CFBP 5621]